MLKITADTSFESLCKQEWLVTNGIGGFAASSICGAHTRRYHGLLTAAFSPPGGRQLMVSKIEESILFGRDSAFSLSSNQYPNAIHPNGYQHLRFFERKPLPRMKYEANEFHLLKTIFMVHGSNTTVVEYENTGEHPFKLRLTPLFVCRDYHGLMRQSEHYNFSVEEKNGYCEMYAYRGAPAIYFRFTTGNYRPAPAWYYNFVYQEEIERGLDFQEDAYAPAEIEVMLRPGEKTAFVFSTDEQMMKADPEVLKMAELQRRAHICEGFDKDTFIQDLLLAGDQFVVRREDTQGYSLIAGYHWFTDWGRDTMIAVRGLCIATGRQEVARSVLQTFLQHIDQGMLPNRFPDYSEAPEYNTIDATLWLFVALYDYHQKFGDISLIEEAFDHLTTILDAHIRGTRYQIKVGPEGFLSGGEGLSQLTWMDARVGEYVVTPRHGCPVEIQALWYNALRIYEYFAGILKQSYEPYTQWADLLQQNFQQYFIQPDGGLYDVVIPGVSSDASIRPNQIYVLSLPFGLLERVQEARVLNWVRAHLLTPYGLRSLSPEDPAYRSVYAGNAWERDTAYHQGTVWPFLLGEYATAWLKVHDWSDKAQQEVTAMFEALKTHFYNEGCLLGVAEIFDGSNPRKGKGAVNQAWSVGAILKTMIELQQAGKSKGKKRP